MKRKRKHKNGKAKGVSAKAAVSSSVNVDNDSEFDKDENHDSGIEIDTPSSTGTDQPHNVADINPDGSIAKAEGKPIGRVMVKLKKLKVMESQVTSSDAPTQSDTDKSSHQMGLEKQGVAAEKAEDSANSSPEAQVCPPGNSTKKAGSIKIKSSKISLSNISAEAFPARDGSPLQKEQKTPRQGPRRYDKEELDTALMVIKKVMKMDAAEPFNVPVNPVALGIPDYFDVIDTPMDFGTICGNLENGVRYANSEDVYKDVQYIWDNCFKYNNKGDYILDLMKRVKKNFTKYWTAAGLYIEQLTTTNGVESSQEKIAPTGQIKVYVKGGLSKKTSKKGHGRRHKSDCLCAICVLKRRRREREENARIAQGHIEESSPAESPSGDNSASDMDESTPDPNIDAEVEQKKYETLEESKQPSYPSEENVEDDNKGNEEENDVEMKDIEYGDATEQFDKSREDTNKHPLRELVEKSGDGFQSDTLREDTIQQPKHKEPHEKPPKIKASQIKFRENPMILELCGTLFPKNSSKRSIWSGPHSLAHRPSTSRTTNTTVHAAIDILMKQPD